MRTSASPVPVQILTLQLTYSASDGNWNYAIFIQINKQDPTSITALLAIFAHSC